MQPSRKLVERAQKGDERAFADLVTPVRARLFTLLVRELGDRAEAEDTLQEVLYLAWRGLPRYEHRGRFDAWMFTIAYHALVSRRRAPRLAVIPERDGVPVPVRTVEHETPLARLIASETAAAIDRLVADLPDQQRLVFHLRHSSDLTFAEIAELTGEPLNTVLSHMRYALQKIARGVNEHA